MTSGSRVTRRLPISEQAEAVGAGAAQDAQHVVLRLGELVSLEHGRHFARQQVGGADQIEVGLFLATGKRPPLLQIALEHAHARTIVV